MTRLTVSFTALFVCFNLWQRKDCWQVAAFVPPAAPASMLRHGNDHRHHDQKLQHVHFPPPWKTARSIPPLQADKWNRDIRDKSIRRGNGAGGETFAGAVLGGLVAGPFGAIFGATIGSNIGARKALDRERQQEMTRLGIDDEMLQGAQEVAEALERASEGLATVQDSLASLQRSARRLDDDATALMTKAKLAMTTEHDEGRARNLLLERQSTLDKLKATLKDCAAMKNRKETMERNVAVLENKALEIETLLQRTLGAKAMQDVGALGLSLPDEDPLLRKFRDMGLE